MAVTAPPPIVTQPIADLTYRGYDGPLYSRTMRWWTISRNTLRVATRSIGFWIVVGVMLLIYAGYAVRLYFQYQFSSVIGSKPQFHLIFFSALCGNMNSLCLLGIALFVGAAAIASDTRANALQVYLAKPITKTDYLAGKLGGVFLTVYLAAVGPALLLFLICGFMFGSDGFWRHQASLLLLLPAAAAIPALVHAALVTGISSWSRTASVAGAIYAGLWVVTNIVATIVAASLHSTSEGAHILVQHLSVQGVIDGLVQALFRVNVPPAFLQSMFVEQIPPPRWVPLAVVGGVLVAAAILAARTRIRAVEVIAG